MGGDRVAAESYYRSTASAGCIAPGRAASGSWRRTASASASSGGRSRPSTSRSAGRICGRCFVARTVRSTRCASRCPATRIPGTSGAGRNLTTPAAAASRAGRRRCRAPAPPRARSGNASRRPQRGGFTMCSTSKASPPSMEGSVDGGPLRRSGHGRGRGCLYRLHDHNADYRHKARSRSAVSFRASYLSARRALNQSARPKPANASDPHCRGAPCGRHRLGRPPDRRR